ncbi:hypothetical protein NUSPORA_00807 [Nucleospora cyclopteri]
MMSEAKDMQQVAEITETLENSAITQKLPQKVKNMGIEDLLRVVSLMKLAYFFPLFISVDLISTSASNNKAVKMFSWVSNWICQVILIDFINYVIYFFDLYDLYNICFLCSAVKIVIAAIYMIVMFFFLQGMLAKVCIIGMAVSAVYIDLAFLMYLNIHFKEITKDDEQI